MRPINQKRSSSLTKSELVGKLSELYPVYSERVVQMAVDVIFDAMSKRISGGGRVEIRGFGSWARRYRAPRDSRNPKTGAHVKVAGKYVPRFKSSTALRSLQKKAR